jgi:hypothetical protein
MEAVPTEAICVDRVVPRHDDLIPKRDASTPRWARLCGRKPSATLPKTGHVECWADEAQRGNPVACVMFKLSGYAIGVADVVV